MDRSLILKEKRLKLGLTQEEVAHAVDIEVQRYCRYEDGRTDIMKGSFDVVCRILFYLGITVEKFYRGETCEEETIPIILRSKKYDAEARAKYTSVNHVIVLAGSRISIDSNLREKGWETTQCLREELIEKGTIFDRVFVTDYDFSSPSEAASVICGRHLAGTVIWYTEDGVKLGNVTK